MFKTIFRTGVLLYLISLCFGASVAFAESFTISNVVGSSIESWMYFNWTTSVPTSGSRVWIGESPGNYALIIDSEGCGSYSGYQTEHCTVISHRKANTTYYFKIDTKDSGGNLVTSGEYTATTGSVPTYTTAPTITNIAVSGITETSATITWTTDQISSTGINYGPAGMLNQNASESHLTKSHNKTLTGLTASTAYQFTVISANTTDPLHTISALQSFTTLGSVSPVVVDTVAPVISNVAATISSTSTSASVTWSTDEASDSQVEYGVTTTYGTVTSLQTSLSTSHSVNIGSLTAGTTYHYRVKSKDSAGNLATSGDFAFTTPSPVSPPPVPTSAPTSSCLGGSERVPGLPNCLMPENLSGTTWNEVDNVTGKVLNIVVCSVTVCGRNGDWRKTGYPANSTYIQTPFNAGYWGQYYTNGVWQVGSGGGIVQPGSSTIIYPTTTATPPTVTSTTTSSIQPPTATPPTPTTPPPATTSFPYGSLLNLTGLSASTVFSKIWGPGSNGIVLGGGLNFSTQVGVGWSQQYGGLFVTSYSIQGSAAQHPLTLSSSMSVSVTGPGGSIIEVWNLESMTVVVNNSGTPGSGVMFTAQPNVRYGGFAWYADNSQKNIEISARQVTTTSTSPGGPPPNIIAPPPTPPLVTQTDLLHTSSPWATTTSSVQTTTPTSEIQQALPQQQNAVISGSITDGAGAILSLSGFVEIFYENTALGKAAGVSFSGGKFSVNVVPGVYFVKIFLATDTGYTPSAPQRASAVENTPVQVVFKAYPNTSTIVGKITDETGAPIAGVVGRVFASTQQGYWKETALNSDGSYVLNIGVGTWFVGLEMTNGTGYVVSGDKQHEVVVGAGSRIVQDFKVSKAGLLIEGYILDKNGQGVADVYVVIDSNQQFSLDGALPQSIGRVFREVTTNVQGYFSATVPGGVYYLRTFVRSDRGYTNAPERKIDAVGMRTSVKIELQKPDMSISGVVYDNEVSVPGAFVWAWSKTGGYQETTSSTEGKYSMHVPMDSSWVIGAAAHADTVEYRADEIAVAVSKTSVMHDVQLQRIGVLPKPAIVRTNVDTQAVVTVANGGPTVVAPAQTFASSGSVEISVTPDTRAPSQGQNKVVGTAYEFSAKDTGGTQISNFSKDVVITIPYLESDIKALGVTEKQLVLSFWDEKVSAWKELNNSVVNAAENTVTAAVNHFTRFAVLAPADVTPPEPPMAVLASAQSGGKIKITWTNPSKDFDHAKIYRSELSSVLGSIIVSEISAGEYIDSAGITNNTTYYYTVRAVDPAGNESFNTTQANVRAIATGGIALASSPLLNSTASISKVSVKITRTLKVGMRGADVTTLQKVLVAEGVYAEGAITGYFGKLTKAAVIKFQEKYTSEILTPVGLTSGSGIVGVKTRIKLNALIK